VSALPRNEEKKLRMVFKSLVTRVERGDSGQGMVEFHRVVVSGPTKLPAKQDRTIPFTIPVPWEAPVTEVGGQRLPRMELGLRTEVSIAKAVDKGDLDPVYITPLESQDAVLDAFGQLGFHFKSADLEAGRIYGIRQELPFYQEIEFLPPRRYAQGITQLEVTFVAHQDSMEVVLELDKRGGLFTEGHDSFARFTVDHATADRTNWQQELDGYLQHAARRRGFF
jgi:sporulation-control protein